MKIQAIILVTVLFIGVYTQNPDFLGRKCKKQKYRENNTNTGGDESDWDSHLPMDGEGWFSEDLSIDGEGYFSEDISLSDGELEELFSEFFDLDDEYMKDGEIFYHPQGFGDDFGGDSFGEGEFREHEFEEGEFGGY